MEHFQFLLMIATVVFAVNAEVDCRQRPPHVNFHNCCELSNIFSEDVKEKCGSRYDDINSHGPRAHHGPPGIHGGNPKHGPGGHCFLSCVVNETGIIVNDELQEDNLVSYLNELFGDGEKVEFLTKKFISCNEKRKDFESKMPERRNGPPHCFSNDIGMLVRCVHIHAFKECPDSLWSDTDECNEARDHFKKCGPKKDNDDVEGEDAEEI